MINHPKDITPRNGKGQPHGWWELYYSDGKPCYQGDHINGFPIGLHIRYWRTGELRYKEYYIR